MHQIVTRAIEESPLNRGLRAVDWLADERNVALVDGSDVTLFDFEDEGTYQIHLLYSSRGRAAIERIKQSTDAMFRDHGAEILFGLIPKHRRDVKMAGRLAGWKYVGDRQSIYGELALFIFTRAMWKGLH